MSSAGCLTHAELLAVLGNDVDVPQTLAHLDRCERCRQRMEQLATGPEDLLAGLRQLKPGTTQPEATRIIRKLVANSDQTPQPSESNDWWHSLLESSPEPDSIGRLGAFDVLGALGRGGMGVVLRGFDPQLKRKVAIKIPTTDFSASAEFRSQFMREAQAAASLSHENVVSIYQVGQQQGRPYLVMELIEGGTLADRLREQPPLSNADLRNLASQMSRGLAAAHQVGLIHGDLKPANILWDKQADRYKLADFGLARYVEEQRHGILAGTPAYMSPEQASGAAVDERSDLYSLGLILRDCATGNSPTLNVSSEWTTEKLARTMLPPLRDEVPQLDRRLADSIDSLLALEPDQRPPSAEAVTAAFADRSHGSRRFMLLAALASLLAVFMSALAAEALGWIDLVAAIGPPPPIPIAYPFGIEGQSVGFGSLAAAIEHARDGERILVLEPGPHAIPAIEIDGKSLEIVGAPGVMPVFVPLQVATDEPAPLLSTNARLRLSGIEIRFQVDRPKQLEDRWNRAAVLVRSAACELESCRFLIGRGNVGVASELSDVVCDRCEFFSDGGVAVVWRPGADQRAIFSHSLIATTAGVVVDIDQQPPEKSVPQCRFHRSTFRTERAVQISMDFNLWMMSAPPLEVTATESVFDSEHVVSFQLRNRKGPPELAPRQAVRMLRRRVTWSGAGNLYRQGGSFASLGGFGRRLTPMWEDEHPLDRWHNVWGTPDSEGALAEFDFSGVQASTRTSDHRLHSLRITAGETPAWAQSLVTQSP